MIHDIDYDVLLDNVDRMINLLEFDSMRSSGKMKPVSYTHLRAHETPEHLVCRLLLEKKNST